MGRGFDFTQHNQFRLIPLDLMEFEIPASTCITRAVSYLLLILSYMLDL